MTNFLHTTQFVQEGLKDLFNQKLISYILFILKESFKITKTKQIFLYFHIFFYTLRKEE